MLPIVVIIGFVAIISISIAMIRNDNDFINRRIQKISQKFNDESSKAYNNHMAEIDEFKLRLRARQLKLEEAYKELATANLALKEEQDKNANLKLLNESLAATIRGLEPVKRRAKISIITKPKTEDKASDL